MAAQRGLYARGEFYLDHPRGKDGKPASPNLYIWWYDTGAGRLQRRSTGTSDFRLACDALDRHYLAVHRPTADDRHWYTVHEAMVDYWTGHGSTMPSAEAIRARLKLMRRFFDHEVAEGRLLEPLLPDAIDDEVMKRFRGWATHVDPITTRKRDPATGEWTFSTRPRSPATAEESIIQLKAALNYNRKRMPSVPELSHLTRQQVSPPRSFRLSVDQIAEMLDYLAGGASDRTMAHPTRLMPLRRYMIGGICTLGRPDAIFDMSSLAARGQWHRDARIFDLNPDGRLQTNKYRAAIPTTTLLEHWLDETDDRLVCNERTVRPDDGTEDEWLEQSPVASVKKAWAVMGARFGVPSGFGPKLLRHSMATILANRGVPMQQVQLALGHEVLPRATRHYVIFHPTYLQELREELEAVTDELAQKANLPVHAKRTQIGTDGRRRRV